jgi:hypothetical protein
MIEEGAQPCAGGVTKRARGAEPYTHLAKKKGWFFCFSFSHRTRSHTHSLSLTHAEKKNTEGASATEAGGREGREAQGPGRRARYARRARAATPGHAPHTLSHSTPSSVALAPEGAALRQAGLAASWLAQGGGAGGAGDDGLGVREDGRAVGRRRGEERVSRLREREIGRPFFVLCGRARARGGLLIRAWLWL